MDEAVDTIEDPDVDDLRVEDLLDPVADEIVGRLKPEVLREPTLHVVHEREIGVALAGLLEQPRVLERHGQAAGERGQQRTSSSLNACSRSRFWSEITPTARSPTSSGTNSVDLGGSPTRTVG